MKALRRFFNVPSYNVAEWIPFLRIIAVPFIFVSILLDVRIYTGFLYLAVFMSDAVDGFVARTYKLVTLRFARLDSTGDMLMLIVGLFGFYFYEKEFFLAHWILIAVVIAMYLLQQVFSLVRFGRVTSFHTVSAKASGVMQTIFFSSMFIFGVVPWLFYLMVVMSVIETLEETSLVFVFNEWKYNVKGLYWVLKNGRRKMGESRQEMES